MASDSFYQAYVEVIPTARGFERSLNKQLAGPARGAGSAAGGAAGGGFVAGFGKAIPILGGVLAAAGLGDIIGDAIDNASTYEQAQGAVEQVFGRLGADAIKAFADGGADTVGQSMNQILKNSTVFGLLGKQAGYADDELLDFSKSLITLGADLSAFSNTSPQEAVEALMSGLRGEQEPLRRFGVFLDDLTLRSRALAMGIYDGVGPLTAQQRQMAAYEEILAQTTLQQGQFSREADTLAGQQARTAAAWENISTKIGVAFLPVARDLSKWFLAEGIPALQEFADWLNKPETQEGIDGLNTGLKEIGSFLRDYVINPARDTIGMLSGFVDFANGVSFHGLIDKLTELPGFWGMVYRAAEDTTKRVGYAIGGMIYDAKQFAAQVGISVARAAGWFASLPAKIGSALAGAATWLYSAGQNVIRGFVNGITSMVGSIYRAITDTVGGAIDWAKDLLGIASPSRVFAEIGENTAKGYAQGIEAEFGRVRVATSGMASAAADGASMFDGQMSGTLAIAGDGLSAFVQGRIQQASAARERADRRGKQVV